jgi:hypothetical protein
MIGRCSFDNLEPHSLVCWHRGAGDDGGSSNLPLGANRRANRRLALEQPDRGHGHERGGERKRDTREVDAELLSGEGIERLHDYSPANAPWSSRRPDLAGLRCGLRPREGYFPRGPAGQALPRSFPVAAADVC